MIFGSIPATKSPYQADRISTSRKGAWAGHSYTARIRPFSRMTLLLDGTWAGKDASALLQQAPGLGAGLQVRLSPHSSVLLDWKRSSDPVQGPVVSQGTHLFCSLIGGWNTGISFIRSSGEQVRIFEVDLQAEKPETIEASLSLQRTIYGDIESDKNSTSTALGLSYRLSPSYVMKTELQSTQSPLKRPDLRTFVKIEYRFGS